MPKNALIKTPHVITCFQQVPFKIHRVKGNDLDVLKLKHVNMGVILQHTANCDDSNEFSSSV